MSKVRISCKEKQYIRTSLLDMISEDDIKKSDFSHIIKHINRGLHSSKRIIIRRLKNFIGVN